MLLGLSLLASCGNSAVDGELIGQAKKLTRVTPLVCGDYYAFDVSLGVLRNGTGSMSTQDLWFTVTDIDDVQRLRDAADKGLLVKVRFVTRRFAICTEDHIMTAFEVVQ
jgi:hypothetical protein